MTKLTGNQIKKEISTALNVSSRLFTCTIDHSAIRIRVKDSSIQLDDVKAIVEKYQKINYCEATGEILSGSNRFVFVQYSLQLLLKG